MVLSGRYNPRLGGGSGGISPAHRAPHPCPPGVGGSKFRWVVTWTLCVSPARIPIQAPPSCVSLTLSRAGFFDSRLGWIQGSWLQGVGVGGVLGGFLGAFAAGVTAGGREKVFQEPLDLHLGMLC